MILFSLNGLRGFCFLFSVCLMSSIFFVSLRAVALDCGRIELTKGRVELLRLKGGEASKADGVRKAIVVNGKEVVDCQDIIVTLQSARAKVRLSGNVLLTLGPHTRISIEEYAKNSGSPTLVHLAYGKIRTLFNPAGTESSSSSSSGSDANSKSDNKKSEPENKQSRFRMRTSTAVAGVRGTDFYLSFEPNTKLTEQATINGAVQVEQVDTGQSVLVNSGQQVVVEQVREKSQTGASETKKELEVKPLVVVSIAPALVTEIKQTSLLVKNDQEFVSPESVKILGAPDDWKPSNEEVPFDLNGLKEEF
ncbi:MAG: FecR domain-containing protein [Bdellovibrionales bacterium]|nr:FecR domain-containing protein [Bdellovibrionales bacterium]